MRCDINPAELDALRWRLPGHHWLYHFAERYYNPNTGSWTQLDPSGGDAAYAYVHDDPINEADGDGEGP